MQRTDDFEKRREHLKNLSDAELEQRFWDLAYQVVDPLIELAKHHTSPSIERSVLLRMGFNSLEAQAIVKEVNDHHLLGKGAGGCVVNLAQTMKTNYLDAGRMLAQGKGFDALEQFYGRRS